MKRSRRLFNEFDENPVTAVKKWITGTEKTIWRDHLVCWTLLVGFHDEQSAPAKSNLSSPYRAKTFLEGFEIFLEKEAIEELADAQLDCNGAFDWLKSDINYLWMGKVQCIQRASIELDEHLQSTNPLEPDITGMAWFRSARSAGEASLPTMLYVKIRSEHDIDLKLAIDRSVEKIGARSLQDHAMYYRMHLH